MDFFKTFLQSIVVNIDTSSSKNSSNVIKDTTTKHILLLLSCGCFFDLFMLSYILAGVCQASW